MSIKKISLISLFIALSVAGASIKIPAIVSSVALDMVPALLGGVMFGSIPGAIIAFIAHLLSAFLGGMPLGPFHFLIGLRWPCLFGCLRFFIKKGMRWLASILFVAREHVGCSTSIFVFNGNGILSRNASVFIHWCCIQYSDCTSFSTTFDSIL